MKTSVKVPIGDVFNLRFIIKRIKESTAPGIKFDDGTLWYDVKTHVDDNELAILERLSNALEEAYKEVRKKGYY